MYENTAIQFRGKTVAITPTLEQGGGVDGYYVFHANGTPIVSFVIPYYDTPEREWTARSDFGKNEVRAHGWRDTGKAEHAVAAALNALDITPKSPELDEFLSSHDARLKQLEAQARVEVEDLLDLNSKQNSPKRFSDLLEEYRLLAFVIGTARNLELYIGGYEVEWGSWPIPATND